MQEQIDNKKTHKSRSNKKLIFVSYSPDASYSEKHFVIELIRQLKDNNFADDLWLDKDEQICSSPSWLSQRLEMVEKCKASILIISESYFNCPVSYFEAKTILERKKNLTDGQNIEIFPILFSAIESEIGLEKFRRISSLIDTKTSVDLTLKINVEKSLAEKLSTVIGSLIEFLEKVCQRSYSIPPLCPTPSQDWNGDYRLKRISDWSIDNIQEWLYNSGVKEFYRQAFAESQIDGYLMMSLTEKDMINSLGIDSRPVRKKIMQQILQILDREHKQPNNWHLRARMIKPKTNSVYIIYDPSDVRLAHSLKYDLLKKNITVFHHNKLGVSKEEFLYLNGPTMSHANIIIMLLTDEAISSPFVFNEILLAEWFGRHMISAVFTNLLGEKLRPSLKAVLGDYSAIDFRSKHQGDCMDILEYIIKPIHAVSGIVLEQAYINRMTNGIQSLSSLQNMSSSMTSSTLKMSLDESSSIQQKIFISYQWDSQSTIEELQNILHNHQISTVTDIGPTMTLQRQTSTLQQQTSQRQISNSTLIICCLTPKYLQTDSCIKDIIISEQLSKPIIPVLLHFFNWPPDNVSVQLKKYLAKQEPIDMSTQILMQHNSQTLIDRIKSLSNKLAIES